MKVKILATTDVHGNIFPTNYTARNNVESFGLARIATAIKTLKKDNNLILVDNGDAFQGTPLLTYAHQHTDTIVNPMAHVFNRLDYDFINLGNHDFNYGQEVLEKFIRENNATLLTSNLTINKRIPGATQIMAYGDKKIAFIGVVTHYIPNWERPAHLENIDFVQAYDQMKAEVERVKDQVDYVIGMYHGGLERDPLTGEPTERLTGENQGYEMTAIDGLDILITGHQHRSFVETVNGVLVTQNTFKGQEFITIDLDLETGKKSAQLHKTSEYPVDETLLEPLAEVQEAVQTWLDQPVGSLQDGPILIDDELDARIHKHPIVSFLNQVQLERSGADISSVALFNGATGFNQSISMRELVSTYLYPNTLVVKRMTGKALREMIEFSAHYFTLDGDQIVPSPEFVSPKPQHYNYDMLDGVEYTLKISNPRGQRLVSLTRNGVEVCDDDTFDLVTNNYRAMGGGNYTMVAQAPTVQDIQEEMVDTIMNYFVKYSPVKVKHTKNIHVIA
ncbi:bifunctional metallophosphatase/5'-nucleotidase [Erysipelothrix sp. HDW6C]|uniref:bifunctional metallophosphatase/5'-nucleotidase n=1 Tax=Erysipelothrix sp. HDW6C TaxID=2714930 RepID=UPI0014085AC8|nr:bifunctional UDP-sugar hydrolase/5'-nucleotidase [Erysipelothrix sp. HDW6C]QIK70528.1 bifunctional metallophosphatase/5'-nucleotidase [Erysipelothrix sp. HDW6C]